MIFPLFFHSFFFMNELEKIEKYEQNVLQQSQFVVCQVP